MSRFSVVACRRSAGHSQFHLSVGAGCQGLSLRRLDGPPIYARALAALDPSAGSFCVDAVVELLRSFGSRLPRIDVPLAADAWRTLMSRCAPIDSHRDPVHPSRTELLFDVSSISIDHRSAPNPPVGVANDSLDDHAAPVGPQAHEQRVVHHVEITRSREAPRLLSDGRTSFAPP